MRLIHLGCSQPCKVPSWFRFISPSDYSRKQQKNTKSSYRSLHSNLHRSETLSLSLSVDFLHITAAVQTAVQQEIPGIGCQSGAGAIPENHIRRQVHRKYAAAASVRQVARCISSKPGRKQQGQSARPSTSLYLAGC